MNATSLSAVLVTQNRKDFAPMAARWRREAREHAGILLVAHGRSLSTKIACLSRVARMLTPELAANQLLELRLFESEEGAAQYIESLNPIPG